jgi:hypothetical protein
LAEVMVSHKNQEDIHPKILHSRRCMINSGEKTSRAFT